MVADLDDWTALHKPASEDGYELTIYSNQPEKSEVCGKDMLEINCH